jgi:hypothetical protein
MEELPNVTLATSISTAQLIMKMIKAQLAQRDGDPIALQFQEVCEHLDRIFDRGFKIYKEHSDLTGHVEFLRQEGQKLEAFYKGEISKVKIELENYRKQESQSKWSVNMLTENEKSAKEQT